MKQQALFGQRVLVTGGREFRDRFLVWDVLDEVRREHGPFEVLIHGAARGVDTFAGDWAIATKIPVNEFPILPHEWRKFGYAAGPKRNEKMFKESKPTLGVAFPGGTGTANMISIMQGKIPLVFVDERGEWKLSAFVKGRMS